MRRVSLLSLLLAVAALAAVEAQIPTTDPQDATAAQPAAPETPAPAEAVATPPELPAPTAAATVVVPEEPVEPLPVAPPIADFVSPHQGTFGPLLRVPPAQKLAMMEAGEAGAVDEPLVARTAYLLAQLTGRYVEDAPRIAELTIRSCRAIRAGKGAASPLEMMEAAEVWKRPAGYPGNVPRRYEGYAALYRKLRVEEKKNHAEALALIEGAPPPPPPPPAPAAPPR